MVRIVSITNLNKYSEKRLVRREKSLVKEFSRMLLGSPNYRNRVLKINDEVKKTRKLLRKKFGRHIVIR